MVMEPGVIVRVIPKKMSHFRPGLRRSIWLRNPEETPSQSSNFRRLGLSTFIKTKKVELYLLAVNVAVIVHNDTHNAAPGSRSGNKMENSYHNFYRPVLIFLLVACDDDGLSGSDNQGYTN